ncbi:unnamed protein product [Notodromas monacha]|uniref:Uncharacterized protein n=1 Tax=Notodromas monacha TaxID=399045 RepID=A0A7R9GAG7_9CRUS|nr:unnamed protein product [Notodromas monacha]CAG0913687.1 unnamed protein product [Notodromas monacha]
MSTAMAVGVEESVKAERLCRIQVLRDRRAEIGSRLLALRLLDEDVAKTTDAAHQESFVMAEVKRLQVKAEALSADVARLESLICNTSMCSLRAAVAERDVMARGLLLEMARCEALVESVKCWSKLESGIEERSSETSSIRSRLRRLLPESGVELDRRFRRCTHNGEAGAAGGGGS